MLTEIITITWCINMITYHDGGFRQEGRRGFRDIVLEVILNDFIEININLEVWPLRKMNMTPLFTAQSIH